MAYRNLKEDCKLDYNCFLREIEGKTTLTKINGYWIWWCLTHNQPAVWCEIDNLKQKIKKLKSERPTLCKLNKG